jgi:hypothetical protein
MIPSQQLLVAAAMHLLALLLLLLAAGLTRSLCMMNLMDQPSHGQ